jgi:hypothetical protein
VRYDVSTFRDSIRRESALSVAIYTNDLRTTARLSRLVTLGHTEQLHSGPSSIMGIPYLSPSYVRARWTH